MIMLRCLAKAMTLLTIQAIACENGAVESSVEPHDLIIHIVEIKSSHTIPTVESLR